MLIAHDTGVIEEDGELVEIEAGRTRIAPEVYERNPGAYGKFFDREVTVPRIRAGSRSDSVIETRTTLPDGRGVAS
jgi:hypothetical protein